MADRICSIEGCELKVLCRGWCAKHYERWRKHGDPTVMKILRGASTEDRLWLRVNKTENCWLWTGPVDVWGYGVFKMSGQSHRAHRISFELTNGPIPNGLMIDHVCHTPRCVRPDHLRLATAKQNSENLLGAQRNSKSGVRGVTRMLDCDRWKAQVRHNGKCIYLGLFDSIDDAEAAVVAKRNELFTHNDADRKSA
ncbi:HNH endonuclease [Mycolicibacterium fortuitum]|uniref:HNH endonuclease n=1 Tax=Mycolicibacterium fortuitum TaxID=1766 RepID=UPI0014903B19|nr:HNH endonuclease [Mycolicibacterium fortuitum]